MNPDLFRMAGTLLASPALPGIASALAIGQMGANAIGALKGAVNPALGGTATLLQQQQMKIDDLQRQLDKTSAVSKYSQDLDHPMTMQEELTGVPAVARTGEVLERGLERAQNVQDMLAYRPLVSQFQKDEMDRNMAAAQIRQNIATNANLIQTSAANAQQIGRTAAQQLGSALTSQYQYQ
jgi:cell fate (sporulation/competence/biofilm development) regulator YmcA (YheA/YmcA/DUF963 family)